MGQDWGGSVRKFGDGGQLGPDRRAMARQRRAAGRENRGIVERPGVALAVMRNE